MTKNFRASLFRDGKWYVAQCLEVDVASQGKTEDEALANLREALALYFEAPRSAKAAKISPPPRQSLQVRENGWAGRARTTIVPDHREIALGTLRGIPSQAGLTPDEFSGL